MTQLIDAMIAHPILINRPIVVTPLGVKLCRPSEAVLDILPNPQRGAFCQGRRRGAWSTVHGQPNRGPPHERGPSALDQATAKASSMGIFERYLTLWVALCIVVGIALGQAMPGVFHAIGAATVAQVNLPVAMLVWLMIVPMLLKIDLARAGRGRRSTGAASPRRSASTGWSSRSRWRCSAGCSSAICSARCCRPIRSTATSPD